MFLTNGPTDSRLLYIHHIFGIIFKYLELKIEFFEEVIVQTPKVRSPHIHLAYDKIIQLGKQRQVQQVLYVNEAGEQTFISIGGKLFSLSWSSTQMTRDKFLEKTGRATQISGPSLYATHSNS